MEVQDLAKTRTFYSKRLPFFAAACMAHAGKNSVEFQLWSVILFHHIHYTYDHI